MSRLAILLLGLAASVGAAGCVDVRDFSGTWSGGVLGEDAVRQGFAKEVAADPLVLSDVDLHALDAVLTTSDGKFASTRLQRVQKFSSDVLASLSFDGDPIRSYLLFGRLASESTGAPAMVFVSLFGDEHVEVRVIRGNDLFGVFHLRRRADEAAAPTGDAGTAGEGT
jgi:hypothetical protein